MVGEPGPPGEALSDKRTTHSEIREIRNLIAELEQKLAVARAALDILTERDGEITHASTEDRHEDGKWRQAGFEYGAEMAARLRVSRQSTSEAVPHDSQLQKKHRGSVEDAGAGGEYGSMETVTEERQRWLFDHLSEGIIHMELIRTGAGQRDNFRILSVNPAFETVTGFKEEQVIGQVLSALEPSIEDSMIDRFAVVSRTGQPDQWEEPVLLFEKTFWIVAISLKAGRCMLLLSDISTGRQKEEVLHLSEKRMRTILDNLPVGVWLVDENGKIVYGNQAGIKIWGGAKYVGIDELHQYRAWWADTGRPILPHEWAGSRAIKKGESSIDEVIEIECFDGSRKIIKNSAVPVFGEKQEILGAVVVNQDISQSRLAEQKLKTSEARLRRLVDSNIIGVMFLDENGHIWE